MYKPDKPKLILAFTSLTTGGGLTFLRHIAPLSEFFEVAYFSLVKPDTLLAETLPVEKASFNDLINSESILVANSQPTAMLFAMLRVNRRFFYVTHGYANAFSFLPWYRRLSSLFVYKLLSRKINFIACGSDEAEQLLQITSPRSSIITIHNAVPVKGSMIAPTGHTKRRYLFIGRICYQKGIDVLLRALADLPFKIELDVAGPRQSSEKAYYRETIALVAETKRLGHEVNLLGSVDINNFPFSDYSFVILPSRFEGFAYLPLELSAAGARYILSDCRGQGELLSAGFVSKYSFTNGSPKSLANCLIGLDSQDSAQTNAECATMNEQRRDQYSYQNFLDEYKELFLAQP